MKVIEIIVSPTGQTKLETRGFKGAECRDASRFLETALGQTTSESLTAEYHSTSVFQQNHLEQKE
ncbi:DUF2997 domain-containing protein [Blastopirellula marina]|uniref:DUF2997 domain-containing protein n=1 Tax=Blastopirellula marina TaxID=124 RepID=A0A2S8GNR4_9BACT|nr:DUF2997 domain-containing protein [Blastopirellula marina]PQO46065.1 hypothetical protein C5Y93_10840 [Blastopirellula marina]